MVRLQIAHNIRDALQPKAAKRPLRGERPAGRAADSLL